MRIMCKETGLEKVFETRQQVLLNLLAPIKEEFSLESNTLKELLKKHKDKPLIKYKPTERQIKRVLENPDYALDIPRYVVEGYDDAVSNDRFDERLRDEFYERYMAEDKKLLGFINKEHPTYLIKYF